uniref:DNA primase/polymerase bifunctional N-terminal domain-containing protein n=1 Tax=Melanthalia intermedia TaxID=172989 RepID=A0A345UAP1_9FLOR|nr:hypothetical protein [Melanthalia intermedia]AXI97527.1 hypothetical protein [Melanthalia intermedia]
MIDNSMKFHQKLSFFNSFLCTNSSASNLPNQIKASQQFCFWKYVYTKNTVKPVKVPYGYSEVEQVLVQSLKNEKYWFSYDQFLTLRDSLSDDFKLGLVLTNGPFTVIDIDNYQKYQPLDAMLTSMLKKGAYIEISPSGRGLHIFYIIFDIRRFFFSSLT